MATAKLAERRALEGLELQYIADLTALISDAREAEAKRKKGPRSAWWVASKGIAAKKVALAILWHITRHREQDGETAPSVVSVALDIAKQLGAERKSKALLNARSKSIRERMIQAGTELLQMAASVGFVEPIGKTRGEFEDRTARVRLTEPALTAYAIYHKRFMDEGLADPVLPLDEPPTKRVAVKPNWRSTSKEKLDLPPAFEEACDHIRRTPWRVNRLVYETMIANLDHKHARHFQEVIKSRDSTAGRKADDGQARFPIADLVSDTGQSQSLSDVKTRPYRSDAKRKDAVSALVTAHEWLGKTFYLDVHCDYRGRIYQGGALRFNGADKQMRPLLEFAEGRKVTAEGKQYLAAFVASQWGEKGNFAVLRQWTEDHTTMLWDTAENPDKHDEWFNLGPDDRWGALAAADAWRRCMAGKPVHLPCSWDAVTSGLQVYALLMRDEELAAKVALLDGTQGTYYEEVGQACGEDRPAAKAVAMPAFYGAESYSTAKALIELERARGYYSLWWERNRPKPKAKGMLSYEELQKLSKEEKKAWFTGYMARAERIIKEAEKRAPPFVEIRDWLQRDVADVFNRLNIEIRWDTPAGFVVIQDNHETPDDRVSIRGKEWKKVRGKWQEVEKRVTLIQRLPKGGIDGKKQKSSLPANVIHSLDANWLVQTVNQAAAYGVKSFGTVHDCFAIHANDVPRLLMGNKDAMVDIFGPDTLASLHAKFQEQVESRRGKIPPPPGQGTRPANLPADWLKGRRALEPG